MDLSAHDIQVKFLELFGKEPLVIRAPGRINLIGEHTDYNDGFVMPAAIDKEIFFGIHSSGGAQSVLHSINYDERHEIDMNDLQPVKEPHWANFLLGVLFQFKERGYPVAPFCCVFGGNIPLGAGMSSSAAMECGFARALNEFNLLKVPRLEQIAMAQWAEHHYVGVQCGIMDQFASVMGKEGHVIVLDCRSLSHRYAPLNLREYSIVLCDTKVKHSLVNSEYNSRRKECEAGVKLLQRYYPEVRSLRVMDIGGNKSGTVSATMNMVGNIGSAVSAIIFPFFVSHVRLPFIAEAPGTAKSFFLFAAIMNVVAIFAWLYISPHPKVNAADPRDVRWKLKVFLVILFAFMVGALFYKFLNL